MLAIATAGVMFIGPIIIGFIPIMVVGALIFMLGIELMEEALVDTWGRLHKLEYLTVVLHPLALYSSCVVFLINSSTGPDYCCHYGSMGFRYRYFRRNRSCLL
jgi:MFS superfamily sulfate permease-like transporter